MTSGYVYLLEMEGRFNGHSELVKIGKSNKPSRRAREQTASPGNIRVLHSIMTNDMDWLEKLLHQDFANERIRKNGEWFALDDDQKKHLQDILILDCIPLGALSELPGRSILQGYFSSEAGQEDFADRSRGQLEKLLAEAGWKLERHEVHISWEKLRAISRSLADEVMEISMRSADSPGLVIAKCERNVICTAAYLHSDALKKAAARAQNVGLL